MFGCHLIDDDKSHISVEGNDCPLGSELSCNMFGCHLIDEDKSHISVEGNDYPLGTEL